MGFLRPDVALDGVEEVEKHGDDSWRESSTETSSEVDGALRFLDSSGLAISCTGDVLRADVEATGEAMLGEETIKKICGTGTKEVAKSRKEKKEDWQI